MKKILTTMLGASMCLVFSGAHFAVAAVSQQEAEQLKSSLTPMGAERAGNKEGTIPAWTGGYTTVPANYKSGDRHFNPFSNEKPLFTITSENMDKYGDKLADGVKALLKKYPQSFHVDVYPTHRTAAAPQWVYDNTARNAVTAKLVNDGLTLEGAYGGVPFPIPKNGIEVHWNHLTRWRGEAIQMRYKLWSITTDGQPVLATAATNLDQYPYYRKGGSVDKFDGNYWQAIQTTDAPAFRAGEALLVRETNDFSKDRLIWQYLAGQRRVRRAPNVGFDTPDFVASGTRFFDEGFGSVASPERYDFKLIGKKEMYVPYNNNELLTIKDMEAIGEHHVKSKHVRWELHRVWVVEATLKAGKRHAVQKRINYHDEDTWSTTIMDGWDAQGKLWRTSMMFPFVAPDIPAVVTICNDAFYNLQTGAWLYSCQMGDSEGEQYKPMTFKPDTYFTPDALVGKGSR